MAPKLHTDAGELVLDLGSPEREAHLERARWEAFAENLRLAYVALTRARHRCTLVWGRIQKGYVTSPLGYLLHPPPASALPPDVPTIQAHLQGLDDAPCSPTSTVTARVPRSSPALRCRIRTLRYSPSRVPQRRCSDRGRCSAPSTIVSGSEFLGADQPRARAERLRTSARPRRPSPRARAE
jgi:ATP-dependent exoDNAse (exonuclease V) beta subunit